MASHPATDGPELATPGAGRFRVDQIYTCGSLERIPDQDGRSVLIDQAMQMLGVSRRTVYYWIRQGRLRTIRTRCGSQRVLLSSIRKLVGAEAPPSSQPASSGLIDGFTA